MQKSKNKIFLMLLGIFIVLLTASPMLVSADTSPHLGATLYFHVTYNNQTITENFSARILACRETGCEYDNGALCINGICEFYYYRIERVPKQMELSISLNGENFTSDMINFLWTEPILFYDVDINVSNKVIVNPSPKVPPGSDQGSSLWISFFIALALTIIIELVVLIIFLKKWKIKTKKWKKPIWTVVIADTVSVPLVWLIFFLLLAAFAMMPQLLGALSAIIIAEAFAVVSEAYCVYWLNKKIINLRRSFILSIVMNIASFIIGGMVLAGLLVLM
ncbi:MAG: hypothetical protein NTX24_03595 [Candidatus Pacearchaeota archaeon]|nr:hypothetical protein [Candidatus Pacearchaeota archaeon]